MTDWRERYILLREVAERNHITAPAELNPPTEGIKCPHKIIGHSTWTLLPEHMGGALEHHVPVDGGASLTFIYEDGSVRHSFDRLDYLTSDCRHA